MKLAVTHLNSLEESCKILFSLKNLQSSHSLKKKTPEMFCCVTDVAIVFEFFKKCLKLIAGNLEMTEHLKLGDLK